MSRLHDGRPLACRGTTCVADRFFRRWDVRRIDPGPPELYGKRLCRGCAEELAERVARNLRGVAEVCEAVGGEA